MDLDFSPHLHLDIQQANSDPEPKEAKYEREETKE